MKDLSFALDPDEEIFIKNRGGTQWLKHLIHEKMNEWSTAYSEMLPKGYRVDFDDALAMAHLPQVTGSGESTDPTELESIYYRIVRSPEEVLHRVHLLLEFPINPNPFLRLRTDLRVLEGWLGEARGV